MMFMAENASRSQRLDEAVAFAQRAVAAAHLRDTRTRLELAKLHQRRALMTDMAHAEFRRALGLVSEVVEERRRWDGPSSEALAVMLDIYIATDMTAAVQAALPTSEGGTAREVEVADPRIAWQGALAALAVGNMGAYRVFLANVPDGPDRRELRVLESQAAERPTTELIESCRRVLDEATDPGMRARTVAALVRLGVWPPEADSLHDSAVLPDETYRILRACYQARTDDRLLGFARLREMAVRSAHAARELVVILEELESVDAALEEAERQSSAWPTSGLPLQLLDLYGKNGREDQAAAMIEQHIGDLTWPSDVRMRLAAWYVAHTTARGKAAQAASFAARALQFGSSPDLMWHHIQALDIKGDIVGARAALHRYGLDPVSDKEMRQWIELHFGVDLTIDDAQVLIDIAHRLPDGTLRDTAVTMLVREVLLVDPQPGFQHSDQVRQQVQRLHEQALHRPGGMQRLDKDDDESLRAALESNQPSAEEYQKLVNEIGQGRRPVAEAARLVGAPYATAVIRRPGGVVPAVDLAPGLRAAGKAAAVVALESAKCVADLSSLHLLTVLEGEDRLRIVTSLKRIVVARSSGVDATMTRDQFRVLDLSAYTASVMEDGTVQRSALSVVQKQLLRESALALELITSQAESANPSTRVDAPADTLSLASEQGLPLFCDDIALRQQARQRGVRAFSIVDLLDAMQEAEQRIDRSRVLRRLAGHYVVDLPLDARDISTLAQEHDWAPVALVPLARAAWWQHIALQHPQMWLDVATSAATHSPETLFAATQSALYGSVNSAPASQVTQRFQQVLVDSLLACHLAGATAPEELLTRAAANTQPGIAPRPAFVLRALVDKLNQRGVEDAVQIAQALLPGVAFGC
jgi:hypothetical protein